ncbi:MAG: FecR domain-containing protein, partial [Alphaproteobacteria bacterium]|nr:FecR domain-containing protein [Alphaproteobacteria bacterium]
MNPSAGSQGNAPEEQLAAAAASTRGAPIGTVETASGTVTVTHPDGTRSELHQGDPVFQGDVIETSGGGAFGLTFADKTTLSMGDNGRVVLDEMIFDPAGGQGSLGISLVQGTISFVTGQIAKMGPDAMQVHTPVATMGIRGTKVAVDYQEGKPLTVVNLEELPGVAGEVVVYNENGVVVLNQIGMATTIGSALDAPIEPFRMDDHTVDRMFSAPLTYLPTLPGDLVGQDDAGGIVNAAPAAAAGSAHVSDGSDSAAADNGADIANLMTAAGGEDTTEAEDDSGVVRVTEANDGGNDVASFETGSGGEAFLAGVQPEETFQADVPVAIGTVPPFGYGDVPLPTDNT